jgi:hypothetical protein
MKTKKDRIAAAEAWDRIGVELEEMPPAAFESYITDLLKTVPKKCNFCDAFSGNLGIPRMSEIGTCMNEKSIYYRKAISEDASCASFVNAPISFE